MSLTTAPDRRMAVGRWHLYGSVIEGTHLTMEVLVGDDEGDPYEAPPTIEGLPLGGQEPPLLPLLGSWPTRPTIAQQNAVLPPGFSPSVQADNEDEYGRLLPDDDGFDW